MFEVGSKYEFRVLFDGSEAILQGYVEKYEHPLLKIADIEAGTIRIIFRDLIGDEPTFEDRPYPSEPGKILNVTSSAFISAQLLKDD